jgi:hypothetical protein
MRARHVIAGLILAGGLAAPQASQAQTLPSAAQFCLAHADICVAGAVSFALALILPDLIEANQCPYGRGVPVNRYDFAGYAYTPNGAAVQQGLSNLTCGGCQAAVAASIAISHGSTPGLCQPSSVLYTFASQFCGFLFGTSLGVCANVKYACQKRVPGTPAQCCSLQSGACF